MVVFGVYWFFLFVLYLGGGSIGDWIVIFFLGVGYFFWISKLVVVVYGLGGEVLVYF